MGGLQLRESEGLIDVKRWDNPPGHYSVKFLRAYNIH